MNIYFLILHSDLPMFGKLNRCGRIIGKSDQYKTLYIFGFGWFLLGNTQRANARCHKSVSPSLCFLILESGDYDNIWQLVWILKSSKNNWSKIRVLETRINDR